MTRHHGVLGAMTSGRRLEAHVEWDEIKRGLVVFAHPDDAEYGCSGTVGKLCRDGKDMVYVVVTDGSKGSADPDMTPQRLISTRQEEQRAAAEVLGVKAVEFLNFPDGMLEPTLSLRKAITAAIRRHKPDLVIAQSPIRDLSLGLSVQHPDHLAAGEATFAAIYPCARDRMTFPELLAEGLEPHKVAELWVSGTTSADYFVDITDTLELKLDALLAHKSQVSERVREFVPDRAKKVGEAAGVGYAEGFRRIVLP
jgi:LmbE family N-acetylglucosaminyl deacetylase